MRKFFIYVLLTGGLLNMLYVACSSAQSEGEYACPDFERSDSIVWNTLGGDALLGQVNDMAVGDSVVYVLGYVSDAWLHLFDRQTGEHLGDFVTSGNGPDEVINATSMRLDREAGKISVFDAMTGRVMTYALDNAGLPAGLESSRNVGEYLAVTRRCNPLPDGGFLLEGSNGRNPMSRHLFLCGIDGRIMSACDSMAVAPQQSIVCMQNSCLKASPDGRKAVSSTLLGGILEVFSLEDNAVTPVATGRYFEPGISMGPDGKINQGELVYGFSALDCTDRIIAGAFGGTADGNDFHRIGIWDWNLTPLFEIKTPHTVLALAISPDETELYAVTLTSGHDIGLEKLHLPVK